MPIHLDPGSFDALIFDCDGTLVDTAPAHYRALQTAFATHSLTLPAPWYYDRVGLTPAALFDAYEAEFGPFPVPRGELSARYATAFQRSLGELREVTLVADIARAWKGRVPLIVASNGQLENVRGSLRSVGLLDLFDHIVAAEDVQRGKPDPDIFLEAARRASTPPARCLVLEDSDEGLAAARAAGARTIDIRESWTPAWQQPTP